ncbi:hypothetical protein V6N13_139234 [Hibiscus sabdariffa]
MVLRIFGVASVISEWVGIISCVVGQFSSDYLGLPLGPKRNLVVLWVPVVQKFYNRLASWKSNNMSYSSILVLIKSVLTSIPSYFLSIFQMTAEISQKLSGIMENFLGGASAMRKKIHWVNWTSLCFSLSSGGLGILNLNIQN